MANTPKDAPSSPRPKRVLVVDDDPGIRDNICEMLARNGYRVEAAANGKHAVMKLTSGFEPDLIVLDLMMPGMNGLELMKYLRGHEVFCKTPVMIMTGTNDRTILSESVNFGVTHLFIKPVNYTDIGKKIIAHFTITVAEKLAA